MITPPIQLYSLPASPAAVGTIRTYGIGMIAYGLAIVIQGPGRWSASLYAAVTALAPSWVWGACFIAFGCLTLAGSFTYRFLLRNVGLYGSALLLLIFGLSTEGAALRLPSTSFAAGVIYFVLATAICWVARTKEFPPDAPRP